MRPIDADAIKLPKGFFEEVDNVPKFYEWLNEQPTIEPKNGKWETEVRTIRGHKIPFFACSVCGRNADGEYPYCPNCGAKMKRREEECEDENWYTELDDPKFAERSE